uniref:Uncharacterized protein n=1 Tax=Lotus japonicus TaxID=34305 RepID=I3T4I2_LOTJA|nr:unknown [Lotus japonicus]
MKMFMMIHAPHVMQELPHRRRRMVIIGLVIIMGNTMVIAKDMFWTLLMQKSGILSLFYTGSNSEFLVYMQHGQSCFWRWKKAKNENWILHPMLLFG